MYLCCSEINFLTHMKKTILTLLALALCLGAHAQLNLKKAVSAGAKAVQAATLTDAQVEKYAREYIVYSDSVNTLCTADDPYALRLQKITAPINAEGLDIKAYKTDQVNAFACADGSIRVYSGLMDIMSDEEILGVIGHEIGHVKNKDSRSAFKTALLTSALRDGVASTGGTAAKLSSSQLGELGEAFTKSSFSKTQEYAADEYGYNFLKEHGVNPWAMALSFEKLKSLQDQAASSQTSAIQQLFSTHPDIVNRTAKMAEKATADGFERPANTEND